MTVWDLDETVQMEILHREILPVYFSGAAAADAPELVVVSGQAGSGSGRVAARTAAAMPGTPPVLDGEGLRAFHPHFRDASGSSGPDAARSVAAVTAGWLQACIRHAREHGKSLVLSGAFRDARAVSGLAGTFAAQGFRTRVMVVGSRRAESLLSAQSLYLRELQAGLPARSVSVAEHDQGFEGAQLIAEELERSGGVDRLTVAARSGGIAFDADREGAGGFAGAAAAFAATRAGKMGRFDATQWLSELHHATAYALSRRDVSREITAALLELHEIALQEVLPGLHVPEGSKFVASVQRTTAESLAALRARVPAEPLVDAAAPILTPSGPDRSGLSR